VLVPLWRGAAGGSALKHRVLDEVQDEEAEAGHDHRGNDAKDAAVLGEERRGQKRLLRVEGGKRLQRLRMHRQGSDGEGRAERERGPGRRSPGRHAVLAQLGRARRERQRGGQDAEHPRQFSELRGEERADTMVPRMDIVRPRSVGMQAAEVGDCSYERRVSSSTRKTTNTTEHSMLQARWPVVTLQYASCCTLH